MCAPPPPASRLVGRDDGEARDGDLWWIFSPGAGSEAGEVDIEVPSDDGIGVLDDGMLDCIRYEGPSAPWGTGAQVNIDDPVDRTGLVRVNRQDGMSRDENATPGKV